jgi:hypothetical protein
LTRRSYWAGRNRGSCRSRPLYFETAWVYVAPSSPPKITLLSHHHTSTITTFKAYNSFLCLHCLAFPWAVPSTTFSNVYNNHRLCTPTSDLDNNKQTVRKRFQCLICQSQALFLSPSSFLPISFVDTFLFIPLLPNLLLRYQQWAVYVRLLIVSQTMNWQSSGRIQLDQQLRDQPDRISYTYQHSECFRQTPEHTHQHYSIYYFYPNIDTQPSNNVLFHQQRRRQRVWHWLNITSTNMALTHSLAVDTTPLTKKERPLSDATMMAEGK